MRSKRCMTYQDAVSVFNDLLLEDDKHTKNFDDMIKKPYTGPDDKVIYLNNMQLRFLNKLK